MKSFKNKNLIKNWIMIFLTLIFVFLYVVVLLGWLKPLSDAALVTRLEPILFVVIGYYFANLPAQKNLAELKEESFHQTKRADAAQFAREQAQKERDALEEKIKNVRTVLLSASGKRSLKTMIEADFEKDLKEEVDILRYSINTATKILNS